MLPASVLYGGQEGLKPLSFKMCAFQGEKPLTNRLLLLFSVHSPRLSPKKNSATVPGPVWAPMTVPMLLIITLPYFTVEFRKRRFDAVRNDTRIVEARRLGNKAFAGIVRAAVRVLKHFGDNFINGFCLTAAF